MAVLRKPAQMHDREREWAALADFATDSGAGAKLGLVYGRRRQGKTLMLDLLAQATGGFVFTALPQTSAQNLDRLSRAYTTYTRGAEVRFPDWDAAVDGLLRLGERKERPTLVFVDEFQYLVQAEPALPSILQIALGPTSRASRRSRARLILCGSAMSVMRGLLSGSAPLRGRAVLEMMVHPFTYREAASFWGLQDQPDLAFTVHALVGGTPAYLAMAGGAPTSTRSFATWVARAPLGSMSALFREGAVLLSDQPELTDTRVYYSVLGAIARGASRRHEIAAILGRSDQSLSHPLAVLESTYLIERIDDALRQRRPVFRIAEPILRTHQLLVAPNEPALVGGLGRRVWEENADTVRSKIYGPHFEEISRQWCLWHASDVTLGGRASTVRSATLPCAAHRQHHELDVVVLQKRPGEADRILAIGEAKCTVKPMGTDQLSRLDHVRDLLPPDRTVEPPNLLLFSRIGFTRGLRTQAGGRADVQLVDLDRMYGGD